MAKSYKITLLDEFNKSKINLAPFLLDRQYNLKGIPPVPQTKIYRARDLVSFEDFSKFIIEHEMEERAFGRINDSSFQKYIRKEFIYAYESENNKLLILSGKKRFVLDFCKSIDKFDEINFSVITVDMGELLSKLPHVKGVWFRFKNGLVRASALMGSNLEVTSDFQKFKIEGDISTLSFHFEFFNDAHPIMVTSDGAIVLYNTYEEISIELELVLKIYRELLEDIINVKK